MCERHRAVNHRLHNLHAISCGRHGHFLARKRQAKRLRRRLISRRHAYDKLPIRHIAAGQRFGNAQPASRRIAQRRLVAIHEHAVLGCDRRLQLASAVVGYGYLDDGLVAGVVYAGNAAGSLRHLVFEGFRTLICTQHISGERDGAETETFGVCPRHRGGGYNIAASILWHRRAFGKRLQREFEAVGINPIAALKHLFQLRLRGVDRHVACTVFIHEGNQVGALAVHRNRCIQLAFAVVGDGNLHRMACAIVVHAGFDNAPKPGFRVKHRTLGDYLANRKLVGFAVILRGEGVACQLSHHIGHTFSTTIFVGEALVGIGKQGRRRLVRTFNGEPELARLHRTAVQRLGNFDTGKRG